MQSKPYLPAIHLMSFYRERFGHREGEFPVCEDVAARSIALPFFPEITEDQVAQVADALDAVLYSGLEVADEARPAERAGRAVVGRAPDLALAEAVGLVERAGRRVVQAGVQREARSPARAASARRRRAAARATPRRRQSASTASAST